MKKLYLLLAFSALVQATGDEFPQDPRSEPITTKSVLSDLVTLEQIADHAKTVYNFTERLFSDINGNPRSHACAVTAGIVVGWVVCKRFSGVGRANRKLDKIIKVLKADGKNADSRKNVIIQ